MYVSLSALFSCIFISFVLILVVRIPLCCCWFYYMYLDLNQSSEMERGRGGERRVFEMHASVHMYIRKTHARLLFMNLLFWNDIHHLLGLPVPSAYSRSMRRAANSWRAWTK